MSTQHDKLGRFEQKGDEPRKVRSLRLTDTTWSNLYWYAELKGISVADAIEEIDWYKAQGASVSAINHEEIRQKLTDALNLPANRGGAIKAVIREVLELL